MHERVDKQQRIRRLRAAAEAKKRWQLRDAEAMLYCGISVDYWGRCAISAPADRSALLGIGSPVLVGRDREQRVLRSHLNAARDGQGSLVLIGGEAGIGKTALAEALCREAAGQDAPVLIGRCYDLTETPPYGPWLELLGRYPPSDDRPSPPPLFAGPDTISGMGNQAALFEQVRDFLGAVSATRPLILFLDDLHWADPASLDLLRYVARMIAALPALLIVTYRADELTRHHPLYRLLPLLEREARAVRLNVRPLPDDAVQALVEAHYQLTRPDAARLTTYLQQRAEGNAFFTTELLRALEEEALLRRAENGWELGDLTDVPVPVPLRQVIDGRLARLGDGAGGLLAVASVIGQEVPLDVWAAASGADEEALSAIIEHAVAAHVIEETPDGMSARFLHALIRETLYEGILPSRRRRMHRQIAEALARQVNADPDAVAYHFRRAGDERAPEWLINAGERAQRSYAWLTAAERFGAAVALMGNQHANADERGWLLARIALLRRNSNAEESIRLLRSAADLAGQEGDAVLAACTVYLSGTIRCILQDFRSGIAEMEEGVAALNALPSFDETRLPMLVPTEHLLDEYVRWGFLAHWLAFAGRYDEARQIAERTMAQVEQTERDHGRADALASVAIVALP